MDKRIGTALITITLAMNSAYAQSAVTKNTDASKPATTSDVSVSAEDDSSSAATPDPYQGFNRAMFSFNETLDKYVLKPVAKFYNLIMPRPLNQGIHNVFLNIGNLPVIANDILQANFYQMANDMWRLGINTTVGIGGLFDIAARMKLPAYSNDFGLTLAKWGYQNSNYLVLPFWGPRTVRDAIGIPVDYYAFSIYPYINPDSTRYKIYALSVVDWRAQALQYQDFMDQAAVDRYSFVRNAYLQRRASKVDENNHRSYLDLKGSQTPVATVDSNNTQLPDNDDEMEPVGEQ